MINKFSVLETSNKGKYILMFPPWTGGEIHLFLWLNLVMITESFRLEDTFKIKSKW